MHHRQCVCPQLIFGTRKKLKGFIGRTDLPYPRKYKCFFVQEIDVVQEFMNMQESLNKDWKKQPAIVML